MLDPQGVDPVTVCDECATTTAIVRHSGIWRRCACGTVFNPAPCARDENHDDATELFEPPLADPYASARRAFGTVLADLALVRRFLAQSAHGIVVGAPRSTLAALQGRAGGASRDASEHQVAQLLSVLQREGADRLRRTFVDALTRYCEETSRPDETEVDWTHARACATRLHGLARRGESRVLEVLASELVPGATWEAAARVVADACAPPALRAAWSAREAAERGIVGRPRRDVTAPPVDAERAAWGEPRVAAAVAVWTSAARAAGGV